MPPASHPRRSNKIPLVRAKSPPFSCSRCPKRVGIPEEASTSRAVILGISQIALGPSHREALERDPYQNGS